ncbi:hypothetical protein BJK05_05620 [Pectobacterium polaris]|uniref:MBL fold metallo-hydrolase n=1 Tax=Pectobacterium polaris TaxID=2042057 RepID=UPI000BAC69BF|nr:MBL fold metallo-hydrolase [Pectobacterium polaris]ASY79507.1 hypothetical protein BJK05_05620 [Pectobacterium polaris]MCA6943204.1 MBL fold metallo-hydrolase [Pectobacterium polaris]MCA6956336.1 MBL fold metallo-hydrolase [Pectobacterium polaris]
MPAKKDRKGISPPHIQADRVDVLTFGVDHGDCQLIEFWQQGELAFRLLYDGGLALSPTLVEHLRTKRAGDKADLDIVVLSHVDADHRKGINDLIENEGISIGELWLPCLPAFRRLSWLFAPRIQEAVTLADSIEARAIVRKIPVVYPLEGYVHRTGHESALQISVISPARKLMKRLYSASLAELQPLLTHTTLPLEWLINSSPLADIENILPPEAEMFDNHTALTPDQFTTEPPQITRDASDNKARQALERYKDSLCASSEPEFFGQSQVNNTSLVLVIDAVLEQHHRRRIVLTGDQENWVWIASEHPMGLAADVMKAPHHGGRIYLSDKSDAISDVEQFWLWTRPRIVTVSANGRHSLPHCRFRESVRMIGATLVCPNKRGKELIFSDPQPEGKTSCAQYFDCNTTDQHPVQRISLSARCESLNAAACLSGNGHRSLAPIVVMQQKLIEPDESFIRWTQTEVRKHAQWLNKQLLRRRTKQLEGLSLAERTNSCFEKYSLDEIIKIFNGHERFELINDPAPVVRYAQSHGLLWAETTPYRQIDKSVEVVAPLTKKEYQVALKRITKFEHLIFTSDKEIDERTLRLRDKYDFLKNVNTEALLTLSARWAGIPDSDFSKYIKSRLFHDLISQYEFRAVRWNYGRYKQPHLILHLYKNGGTPLSDFLPNEWEIKRFSRENYDNEEIILDPAKMVRIFEDTTQSVMPPISFWYNKDSFCLRTSNLKDFYQQKIVNEDGELDEKFSFISDNGQLDWFRL